MGVSTGECGLFGEIPRPTRFNSLSSENESILKNRAHLFVQQGTDLLMPSRLFCQLCPPRSQGTESMLHCCAVFTGQPGTDEQGPTCSSALLSPEVQRIRCADKTQPSVCVTPSRQGEPQEAKYNPRAWVALPWGCCTGRELALHTCVH